MNSLHVSKLDSYWNWNLNFNEVLRLVSEFLGIIPSPVIIGIAACECHSSGFHSSHYFFLIGNDFSGVSSLHQ